MQRSYRRYLVAVLATIAAVIGGMLAVNLLVDPLWYLRGNVISGMNYQFNERHSKAQRFLKNPGQYDCIILGSSTGSLLNERKIAGYRCFNFSFSHGNVAEYVTYAKFARRYLKNVRMVVVSADVYNLLDSELDDRSPPFVRDPDVEPPSLLAVYLDRHMLAHSIRVLTKERTRGIYYRADFTTAIFPGSPVYEPEDTLSKDFERRFRHKATDPFGPRNIALFREIREIFPEARFVGVSPPIAAHYVAFLRLAGTLDGLIEAQHRLSTLFDRFYDFTVPSWVTKNPGNTYDGKHFAVTWNDRVIDILNGRKGDFGVRLHEMSLRTYRALFLATTDDLIEEANLALH